ncbi:MAG: hypothetical protein AAF907_01255 [Planctomycetota bacterium]
MNVFRIDDTNFGIDETKSSCSIETVDGDPVLMLELYGSAERYHEIEQNDDSPWSWTLYPPRLYLFDLPLSVNDGGYKGELCRDDLDGLEAAIYLMEHNDLDGVELTVDGEGRIAIQGTVFLSGRPHPFFVQYNGAGTTK